MAQEPGTVLVVDDDKDIRDAVTEYLEDMGHKVLEAENGAQAFEILDRMGVPCVILLDLMMPVMSGDEFLSLLEAEPRRHLRHKVVVMSASPQAKSIVARHEAHATLTKPFSLEELREILDRLCRE